MNVQNKTKNIKAIIFISIILALLLAFSIQIFAADTGDYIKIGSKTYKITNAKTLVDADLALLEYRAKDSQTTVTGVLEGETVSGFEETYAKIYDMLLALYDDKSDNSVVYYEISSSGKCPTDELTEGVALWKISGNVVLDAQMKTTGSSTKLIIIAEDSATITMTTSKSRFYITSSSKLIIQGRNANKNIKVTSSVSTKHSDYPNAFQVYSGSLYLRYSDLNGFNYYNTSISHSSNPSFSVICFPSVNAARYLYMSDSYLQNIAAKEAPGIFCKAYSTSGNYAKNSKLYINYSTFKNCVTPNGASDTVGGSAIRSYAADMCNLEVRNSTFEENRVGSKSTAQTGTATGGGAIYWKSVEGKAKIINCTFKNNHSSVDGGAILNMGTMDIIGCYFENNKALKNGGAIAVETPYTSSNYDSITNVNNLTGTLNLDSNTKLINNTATLNGGGIYFNGKSSGIGDRDINTYEMKLNINGAEVRENKAGNNGGGVAIYLNYASRNYETGVTINEGSLIQNNSATDNGGAIWINSKSDCDCKDNLGVIMNDGTLDKNSAKNGGAIYIETGKADVEMNFYVHGGTVKDNKANSNGGAAYIKGGNVIMTGGTVTNCTAKSNGGAIYVDSGEFEISGGLIEISKADKNGGAVYVSGGDAWMTGGTIDSCEAINNGGSVCVDGGTFAISNGTIEDGEALMGGAVYVSGGNAIMSGGNILSCKATQNGGAICVDGGAFTITSGNIESCNAILGGAVYVSGGNANVNGGTLTKCNANQGGAIYVVGGMVKMLDGAITQNKATNGSGGAIYVTGTIGLEVIVQSGEISGNSSTENGGAICVIGQSTERIVVQIGVNEYHNSAGDISTGFDCDHNSDIIGNGFCPKVENNTCSSEGGAIFISGTKETNLNIFCIQEKGNRGAGKAAGSVDTSLSDFLKVDGGSVHISSSGDNGEVNHGHSEIYSSIHVTGGDLKITGTLANPAVFAPITVDVLESGGSYTDTRINDTTPGAVHYYIVKYFENYRDDKTGLTTGQYTVVQTPKDQSHTVWGVIYSHPGLTIIGWNTKDDGSGHKFGVSTVINYSDFEEYLVNDGITLEMYAIWEKDFYWIKFEPNADSYSGSMGDSENKVSFLCGAESTELPMNLYINVGHRFLGWSTESDATTPTFTDSEAIAPLSKEFGDVVVVYAVWEVCEHDEASKFVFTESTTNSITCTCQCHYYVTMTLNAPTDAVYNKAEHPVILTYTDNSKGHFNKTHIAEFLTPNITYVSNEYEQRPINAGHYKASTNIAGVNIFVEFDIAKAYQSAPSKPVFTVETVGTSSVLKITQPENNIGQAETQVNYKMVHNDNDVDIETPWQTNLEFSNFESSWTLYYVVAYYPGNQNYYDSEEIVSDQKYIFQGNIHIIIVNGEGILQTKPVEGTQNKVAFVSKAYNDYYLSENYVAILTSVDMTDGNGNSVDKSIIENNFVKTIDKENGIFSYVVNSFDQGYSGTITIEFSGAKHKPTTSSSVAPNECFGNVTNTATEIGSDSAFTVYYEIKYFDSTVYDNLKILFDSALPKNTTVIMIDKVDCSYWYTTITQDNTTYIDISSFTPMGGGDKQLDFSGNILKYQFIIDFSDVEANDLSGLNINFSATVNDSYAPSLPNAKSLVSIVPVTHTLKAPTTNANTINTEIKYSQGASNASKWTDREIALVITPDAETMLDLPIDVSLKVVETILSQTKTTNCTLNDNGSFVVTLNPNTSDVQIVLQSQMFQDNAEYTFTIQLYAAYDGDSPMNGILLETYENVKISSINIPKNGAKITVLRNSRIYDIDTGKIEATIDIQLGEGYTATVTLMKKDGIRGYISTAWSEDLKTGSNQIKIENLTSFSEGVFCLSVVIRDGSNTAVMTVPYYLIIQK